jgi:hypothetical protein
LTPTQAEAARLAAGRNDFVAIRHALSLPSYRTARAVTLKAQAKLRRAHSDLVRLQRQFTRDLMSCLRNVTDARPARVLDYAPIAGGGFDSRPISLRPRPEGELPEDLLQEPLAFLHDLPHLLKLRARVSAGWSGLAEQVAQCAVSLCG